MKDQVTDWNKIVIAYEPVHAIDCEEPKKQSVDEAE